MNDGDDDAAVSYLSRERRVGTVRTARERAANAARNLTISRWPDGGERRRGVLDLSAN